MKALIHTTLTILLLTTVFSSQAMAQRRIDCNNSDTKKFVSNLLAKKLRKPKPYATPFSKKVIWPYLMKIIDKRRSTSTSKVNEGANNFNHAHLVLHAGKGAVVKGFVTKGKMGISTCSYTWAGRGLTIVKPKQLRVVSSQSMKVVKPGGSSYQTTPKRKGARVTLVYVSPANVAVYKLHVSAR